MNKNSVLEVEDGLRSKYELTSLLRDGEQGQYAGRYEAGTNVVLLDPDVARVFPTSEAVNAALRLVIQLTELQQSAIASAKT